MSSYDFTQNFKADVLKGSNPGSLDKYCEVMIQAITTSSSETPSLFENFTITVLSEHPHFVDLFTGGPKILAPAQWASSGVTVERVQEMRGILDTIAIACQYWAPSATPIADIAFRRRVETSFTPSEAPRNKSEELLFLKDVMAFTRAILNQWEASLRV